MMLTTTKILQCSNNNVPLSPSLFYPKFQTPPITTPITLTVPALADICLDAAGMKRFVLSGDDRRDGRFSLTDIAGKTGPRQVVVR